MSKVFVALVAICMALPVVAQTTTGGGKTKIVKPVFQDNDASQANYLKNRRALVGPGCTVNSLFDGINVVAGVSNLQNLCNEDLSDYTTLPGLASVVAGASPIISIKDNKNYYAADMEAGFSICAASDAKILSLDLAKFYKIQFLCDGEKVGDPQGIKQGQSVTGLGLSLLTIPGDTLVTKSFVAKAPGKFNEIKLVQCGVDATVLSLIKVKYAFVGKAREYTITNNTTNGIGVYAKEQGRGAFTLSTDPHDGFGHLLNKPSCLIDADLKNSFTVSAVVSLGASTPITVYAKPSDDKEAFPAGTEVGFKYNSPSVLNLGVGNGAMITLYNKKNEKIGSYPISTTVLGLSVLKEEKDGELVMKAPADFSAVKLVFPKIIDINLGADVVNYAFVRMAAEPASHHCAINAPSSYDMGAYQKEFTLQHNPKVDVTWSIVSQPEGSDITLDAKTGLVSNISVPGDYTFKALAADNKCSETTTIHYAKTYKHEDQGVTLLVNDGKNIKYQLSDKFGGGLLSILGDHIKNSNAILTSSLSDFTYRIPNVELAANTGIVGVKTVDGSCLAKDINNTRKVGFVVSSKATGLVASVLKLYNIKLFNKGKEVYHSATTHWGAISAGLVGKEETNKKCLSIDVPADLEFDEAVLYNTGLLKADLAQLNIYYAYVSDATKDNAIENALYGAESISTDNTNASVDLEHTKLFSVANVGNGYDRIGNLIDGDPETSFVLPLGVNIGGATVAVNIGKTVNPGKQLVMTTDNLALGLGVNLGDVLKVTTYLNGEEMESLSNWQALSASVISTSGKANVSARAAAAGSDNKGYLVLTPTKPFDNVRIKQVDVASVLSNITIYDLALRNNISEEGSVNTGKDLVLDENYKLTETNTVDGARLVFNRTFATGKWNSLILPVDMSLAQVKEAFGEDAELSGFDKMDGTWIYFKPVTTETNGVLLQKNKPYIIKPTKEPLANCEYTVDGSTQTLEGKIYIVNGVNYTDQTSEMVRSDNGNGVGMVIKGGYDNPTAVPSRSYMLNNGNMIHTAKVHNVKAYRTWLEETTPSNKNLQMAIRYADGDNTATGITVVEEQDHTSANGIYTISGMRVDGYNAGNLPKGMYIVNNRKMIVK